MPTDRTTVRRDAATLTLPQALHGLLVEELEPQGAAENTRRAYASDIVGVAQLAVAAGRPESDGMTGRELAALAAATVTEADLDVLVIAALDGSTLRRAFGAWTATHAVTSARRAHSAWSRLFDHLTATDVVDGNPMAGVPKATARASIDATTGRADDVRSLPGDPADVRDALLSAAATPVPSDAELVPGSALARMQTDPRTRVRPDRDPWPARDVAMVATFLYTAARLQEVADLTNGALTGAIGDRTLTIVGKGGKRRQVAVHRQLELYLASYRASDRFAEAGSMAGPAPLLAGNDGKPMSRDAIRYRIAKLYRRTGLEEQRSPGALVHALRHTVAVQLVENGVPTPAVQEFLGHASQDTTMRYVRKVARDQRRVLDAMD
jgi:site-specific recombinase XerD